MSASMAGCPAGNQEVMIKALAWYSVIFNVLVIIAFILFLAGVMEQPPFSNLEAII